MRRAQIRRAAQAKGDPLPPEVAIELGPLTAPIWETWELLNGARRWQRTMDGVWPDPLALTEVLALVPMTGHPAALVVPVLRALDDIWLGDVISRLQAMARQAQRPKRRGGAP